MKKLHVTYLTAECFPAAKVGGLADVMGSLPLYLDADVEVVMPKYKMPWFEKQGYNVLFSGTVSLPYENVHFTIESVVGDPLGFPLVVINIPGKFDRDGVYASASGEYFVDESERYSCMQRAFLDWVLTRTVKPDIIHSHDHHTGLIPFMLKYSYKYQSIKNIPTAFTIHNERYQGAFGWEKQYLIEEFDSWKSGLLDWDNRINPLASAVKCADRVTTVSPSYMEELKNTSYGLEWLFNEEQGKSVGILNGIDPNFWNPKTDSLIHIPMKRSIAKYKRENKSALLQSTELDPKMPLTSFIGRFAKEKGADILPEIIENFIQTGGRMNFLILGSGDAQMESEITDLMTHYPNRVHSIIAYNEKLAHQIYAGTDFLIMPSRVEPCGLNQMYALRYGTIPIVHDIGGLHDSISNISENESGTGIKFSDLEISSIRESLVQASRIFNDEENLQLIRKHCMKQDFSWNKSAKVYMDMYLKIANM